MNTEDHIIFIISKDEYHQLTKLLETIVNTAPKQGQLWQYRLDLFQNNFLECFKYTEGKTYSLRKAAMLTGEAERTIRRRIATGELYAYHLHGEIRIPEENLAKYMIDKRRGDFFPRCS